MIDDDIRGDSSSDDALSVKSSDSESTVSERVSASPLHAAEQQEAIIDRSAILAIPPHITIPATTPATSTSHAAAKKSKNVVPLDLAGGTVEYIVQVTSGAHANCTARVLNGSVNGWYTVQLLDDMAVKKTTRAAKSGLLKLRLDDFQVISKSSPNHTSSDPGLAWQRVLHRSSMDPIYRNKVEKMVQSAGQTGCPSDSGCDMWSFGATAGSRDGSGEVPLLWALHSQQLRDKRLAEQVRLAVLSGAPFGDEFVGALAPSIPLQSLDATSLMSAEVKEPWRLAVEVELEGFSSTSPDEDDTESACAPDFSLLPSSLTPSHTILHRDIPTASALVERLRRQATARSGQTGSQASSLSSQATDSLKLARFLLAGKHDMDGHHSAEKAVTDIIHRGSQAKRRKLLSVPETEVSEYTEQVLSEQLQQLLEAHLRSLQCRLKLEVQYSDAVEAVRLQGITMPHVAGVALHQQSKGPPGLKKMAVASHPNTPAKVGKKRTRPGDSETNGLAVPVSAIGVKDSSTESHVLLLAKERRVLLTGLGEYRHGLRVWPGDTDKEELLLEHVLRRRRLRSMSVTPAFALLEGTGFRIAMRHQRLVIGVCSIGAVEAALKWKLPVDDSLEGIDLDLRRCGSEVVPTDWGSRRLASIEWSSSVKQFLLTVSIDVPVLLDGTSIDGSCTTPLLSGSVLQVLDVAFTFRPAI